MEGLVAGQPKHLILRLPNVVGRTPNPHTLFNFLYARIARGERFKLWTNAWRRIIDVLDVMVITELLLNAGERNGIFNVMPSFDYKMDEIVAALEKVIGKSAIYDATEGEAESYLLTGRMAPQMSMFRRKTYLDQTIRKYYG
jgi:nucleoside-diphosphate-sugar epimerase